MRSGYPQGWNRCRQCRQKVGVKGGYCSSRCEAAYAAAHPTPIIPPPPRTDVKVCVECGHEKPIEAFWRARRYRLGRDPRCRECLAVIRAQRRIANPIMPAVLAARLEGRGVRDDQTGCLEWDGNRLPTGYGYFSWKMHTVYVHRLSAAVHLGLDYQDRELCALHRCDNPPCFEPAHLFIGAGVDNQADCIAKGRKPVGELHPHARLSEDQVRVIRSLAASGVERPLIAIQFGVSNSLVDQIVWRHIWKSC